MKKFKVTKARALTCAAMAGVPMAVFLGCWGTKKAIKKIDEHEREFVYNNRKTPNKLEKYIVGVPYYIPTIVVTGLTMVAIFNNEKVNEALLASALGASTVTAKAFQDYKDAVVKTDEEVAHKAEFERGKKDGETYVGPKSKTHESDELLYFRDVFGVEWLATELEMSYAVNKFNRLFQQNHGVPLTDWYICNGCRPSTEMGEHDDGIGYFDESVVGKFGWCVDFFYEVGYEIIWIDIWFDEIELEDGRKGYLVSYDIEPITNWEDYPVW